MAPTQIYVGEIPADAAGRRALRERALEIAAQLRQASQPAPSVALLNFAAGDGPLVRAVDLLLLRPSSIIVGAVRAYPGPLEAAPGGPWRERIGGAPVIEPGGISPLELVRAQRDAVAARLHAPGAGVALPASARVVGALVCAPATHPDSRISLDVDDHRHGLKVLGLDELAATAAMVQSGVNLSEDAMRAVACELFGGRLWIDGGRVLFELAPARFQLRLLSGERAGEAIPLAEGETVLGRRRTPRRFERRIALAGDDLISSDHAALRYGDEDHVLLRDSSKNGTWVLAPDGQERHLRGAECALAPGAVLRMGVTHLRLERIDEPPG
ncbi:MAG TPA: FHA domain-containing protein [Roseiflexaceae bacterium]|nr:FHA domain-containing protein [Roseiflexaceae bacterium]